MLRAGTFGSLYAPSLDSAGPPAEADPDSRPIFLVRHRGASIPKTRLATEKATSEQNELKKKYGRIFQTHHCSLRLAERGLEIARDEVRTKLVHYTYHATEDTPMTADLVPTDPAAPTRTDRERIRAAVEASVSPATRRVYRSQLARWGRWADARDACVRPVDLV